MARESLDPRLSWLMKDLGAAHELRKQEDDRYRGQWARIEKFGAEVPSDADEMQKMAERLAAAQADVDVPTTFGLYFPEDDPEAVKRVTDQDAPFVSATIRSDASAEDLAELGVHVRSQARNVFSTYASLEAVEQLSRSSAVEYIELARPWEPDLATAIPQTQLDTLHNAASPVTGAGVVVGVIDSGFDFYHPDFRINDGTGGDGLGASRVLFFWDQRLTPVGTEAGPPVGGVLPGFVPAGGTTYGVEYTQANITADFAAYQPGATPAAPPISAPYQVVRSNPGTNAHGTFVAGCAAGNGRSGAVGAAPGSSIIYVRKGTGNNYIYADSTNVLDGFAYIFARATALGLPCVVNLSSSDNLGGHDGTTNGEQFLDNLLLVPGRAITCAAGNTNATSAHTNGTVAQGGTTTATLTYAAGATSSDTVHLWYDGHDRFTVTVTPPAPDGPIGPVAAGGAATSTLANGVTVTINSIVTDPRNGDNLIEIRFAVPGGQQIPVGAWQIALQGTTVVNGSYEAWVDRSNRGDRQWTNIVTNNGTIAVPATGLRPIAVGAHDAAAAPVIGGFSSQGPTRDARIKPEVAAPGVSLVAAASWDRSASSPTALTRTDSGTSFAAPLVAGAAAVAFECRGATATWADIKQVLGDGAGTPAVGVPSNSFGFGFLQAGNICAAPATDVDVWMRDATDDTGVEPYVGPVGWRSPDIRVLDAGGNPTPNPTYHPTNLWNTLIDVEVRNRGTQTARNVEVFLHWADPGTNLAYPTEWQTSAIYTGNPSFLQESNKIVIPQLAAGATTVVRYAWAPPAPGANVRGDNHFCLLARVEHQADPSNVGNGGGAVIKANNNIVMRNVNVQPAAAGAGGGGGDGEGEGDAATAFYVIGTDDVDTLEIFTEELDAELELAIPLAALPWREMGVLDEIRAPRPRYGDPCGDDPLTGLKRGLEGRDVERVLDVAGAGEARIADGVARVRWHSGEFLRLGELRLGVGTKMPMRVTVTRLEDVGDVGAVHIAQRSGGQGIGGTTLELHRKPPKQQEYAVVREGDEVTVKPVG